MVKAGNGEGKKGQDIPIAYHADVDFLVRHNGALTSVKERRGGLYKKRKTLRF